MEKDDEVSGEGNSYTTYFRQYDSRLGRWKSLDPIYHTFESPYVAMHNNPIFFDDPNGDCPTCITGAIVGALVEFGGLLFEHMYEEDKNFTEALLSLTWTDGLKIGTAAAGGAIMGSIDGGSLQFLNFAKSKVGRKIIGLILEGGVDFLAGILNKYYDEDITSEDIMETLFEVVVGSALGEINLLKKVDLVDKKMLGNKQSQLSRSAELLERRAKQGFKVLSKQSKKAEKYKRELLYLNVQDVIGRSLTGVTTSMPKAMIKGGYNNWKAQNNKPKDKPKNKPKRNKKRKKLPYASF